MSIKDKYSSPYQEQSCCGQKKNTRKFSESKGSCCNDGVPHLPSPACESHDIQEVVGICFRPICDIIPTSTDSFPLTFEQNQRDIVPINANETFFYHPGPGLMRIVGYDGRSYQVSLVDTTRAGRRIQKGDCVSFTVQALAEQTPINTRCLCGKFVAPELNQGETLVILNGSGIPVGAIITFTANGEIGSYEIQSFKSAQGNLYAYEVQNVGDGHTPGTIIEGDDACSVPIEVQTQQDTCNAPESNNADLINACTNGTVRGLVPDGPGDIIVGSTDGRWELQKVTNLDCCVLASGCIKFTGEGSDCSSYVDTIVLRDPVPQCFLDAVGEAAAADQSLPMNINGINVVATNYNTTSRQLTLELVDVSDAQDSVLEFDENTQICLGECCSKCTLGSRRTDHKILLNSDLSNIQEASIIGYINSLDYPAGVSHWLIGGDNVTGAGTVLQLDAAYFANPSGSGPGLPRVEDPMLFRQKICNTSLKGCDELAEVQVNIEAAIDPVPAGMIVDWEVAHFAQPSATLADGVTPNPSTIISTQKKVSGRVVGPSFIDPDILNTSLGLANPGITKVFPTIHDTIDDCIELRKCDCALSIVWFYLRIHNAPAAGTLNTTITARRKIIIDDHNEIPSFPNNPASEGFNN